MRSGYNELGIPLREPLKDDPHRARWPHMVEEMRGGQVGDPIKLLLEEAVMRQRNEMMDNFSQILCQLPTTSYASTSSGHSRSTPPFKVQVNFNIPVFEG